jgi:Flp pilus assembly protein CpaB
MDVPEARRATRPSWVNVRTVLGLLLFAAAFLAAQRVLERAETTVAVWVAAHDLGAGTVVGDDDVVVANAKLPADLLGRYTTASTSLDGVIVNHSVRAGELIPASALGGADPLTPGRSMTIPVTPEHANGGSLRPGDRIDVFATFNPGDVRARTSLLVGDVTVIDVVTAGGLVAGEESAIGVTVELSPSDAARVAFAVRTGEIDIARITGATTSGPSGSVGIEDFR